MLRVSNPVPQGRATLKYVLVLVFLSPLPETHAGRQEGWCMVSPLPGACSRELKSPIRSNEARVMGCVALRFEWFLGIFFSFCLFLFSCISVIICFSIAEKRVNSACRQDPEFKKSVCFVPKRKEQVSASPQPTPETLSTFESFSSKHILLEHPQIVERPRFGDQLTRLSRLALAETGMSQISALIRARMRLTLPSIPQLSVIVEAQDLKRYRMFFTALNI